MIKETKLSANDDVDYRSTSTFDFTEKVEHCVCKKCGVKFFPTSHNKKVFCSAECFKSYKQSGSDILLRIIGDE